MVIALWGASKRKSNFLILVHSDLQEKPLRNDFKKISKEQFLDIGAQRPPKEATQERSQENR
jgi:hypothetical protein